MVCSYSVGPVLTPALNLAFSYYARRIENFPHTNPLGRIQFTRAVNEPPWRPLSVHTRTPFATIESDSPTSSWNTSCPLRARLPSSNPYMHAQVISHIFHTALNPQPRSCCSATHALRIDLGIGFGAHIVLCIPLLAPSTPPIATVAPFTVMCPLQTPWVRWSTLRTLLPDRGWFELCTSRHPLAPEAYESHADFILEMDMTSSSTRVSSVTSCESRLPRPGRKFIGPACADSIHLTSESTLSLTASLATKQLISFVPAPLNTDQLKRSHFFGF